MVGSVFLRPRSPIRAPLRAAPFLFNQLADAIEWVIRHRAHTDDILHYLDDYFTAGPPNSPICQQNMDAMLHTCRELSVPIAPEKISGPSPVLEFLGILLDAAQMVIRLLQDKFDDLLRTLPAWLHRTSCTKHELLSIIGTLSFACKCIPAGRIFLRRMIDLSTTVSHLNSKITLSDEFRLDIQWWCNFLPTWNGSASLLDATWTPSPDIQLFTDASGTIGCGGYYAGQWFTIQWPPHLTLSIEWKEMYPIFVACSIWGDSWHGSRVLFHCDNETVFNI